MPTYIAFAADGAENVYDSDIKYYRLLTGWDAMKGRDFELINVHERGSQLRSASNDETIKKTLKERLNKSKRMILLVGKTTKKDDDFVPFEIEYAVDTCKIPIIVTYVELSTRIIVDPHPPLAKDLRNLLPMALLERMENGSAKTIHIPFRQRIISKAIEDYSKTNLPSYSFGCYKNETYDSIYKSEDKI